MYPKMVVVLIGKLISCFYLLALTYLILYLFVYNNVIHFNYFVTYSIKHY